MSDYYDEDDNTGGDLVSDLRKQRDKEAKRANALEKELAEMRQTTRSLTVKEKIAAKGLDPRIAAIIPSDVDDLDSWLEQFGDLFGAAPSGQSDEDRGETDAELAELSKQAGTEGVASDDDGLLSQINSTGSLAELEALIKGQ